MSELNINDLLRRDLEGSKEPIPVCVVRLITSFWHDGNGVYIKKSLRILRRKSSGYNILLEDCSNSDAEEVLTKITNLDKCEDDIYQVVTCDEIRDWESGYVEDYSYRLIPYEEIKQKRVDNL